MYYWIKLKKSIHYRWLKQFDIVIGEKEKLIVPMNDAFEELRYYVCYNICMKLFMKHKQRRYKSYYI